MARFDPIASNFSTGEISEQAIGRVDIAKYANGVDTLENFLNMMLGGITRRPGLRYIATTKSNGVARLMPFQYSADQDYVIEMGDEYMKFYSNNASLVVIPSAVDLDYMEYATDGAAQAAYVSTGAAAYNQVAQGDGTVFGDMTLVGGLAAAFDSNADQGIAAAATSPGNSHAYIGKDWGVGVTKTITQLKTYASNDRGYDTILGAGTTIAIFLYGSNSAPAHGTDGTLLYTATPFADVNNANAKTYNSGITTTTAYRYHWVYITTTAPAENMYLAEVEFFTSTAQSLLAYSEGTIKSQGSYSLKAVAVITTSLNKILTRTIAPTIDLTGINTIKFDIYSSRTGANIKIGIHDSGGTTSEKTYTVLAANTWETVTWDISAVSNANKDAIDSIIITIVNADANNTFYIDNMYPYIIEIVSPYDVLDIFEVQQAHKGDIKYLTHGDYAPRKLSRTTATTFSIALVSFVRGPFLDTNTTAIAITPTSDTGVTTLNAASGDIFHYDNTLAADAQLLVGSLFRVKSGVVKILTVATALQATGTVQAEPDGVAGNLATGPGATTDWAEGAFSGYRGYPAICAFHDGRLYYACTEHEPQKIWGSCVYDYDNFDAGTAADDDAVKFEIATEERVAIRWLLSGNKALTIGSTGGTFSASGAGAAIITPGDIQVNRDTNYGSALLPAKRISSFSYYIQRNLRKLRELSYYYDYDVTRASDMTMLAEHILRDGSGVVDWDYQQSPNDRLWCVRDDGQIAVITRNPEQDVMGWARIIAGTDSTDEGQFKSMCVIPKANADDQVWVIVRRMIDGTEKRFIEFFTNENFDEEWDAICLDASLTLDNPKTITGMTNASPGVFACTGHGFSTGDQVKVNGVVLGNVSGAASADVNGTYLLVEGGDANHFTLTTLLGVAINTTTAAGYGIYASGGEIRKMVDNVTGLAHLERETVQVQVDGSVPTSNSFVVTGGTLVPALTSKAAVVHVGLPYTPYMKTLRPEGGSQAGTAQGKTKRIVNIVARFYRTLAARIGTTVKQDRFTFDSLYTGDKPLPLPIGWEREGQLVITSDKPLPLTLISLMPNISVSDL